MADINYKKPKNLTAQSQLMADLTRSEFEFYITNTPPILHVETLAQLIDRMACGYMLCTDFTRMAWLESVRATPSNLPNTPPSVYEVKRVTIPPPMWDNGLQLTIIWRYLNPDFLQSIITPTGQPTRTTEGRRYRFHHLGTNRDHITRYMLVGV